MFLGEDDVRLWARELLRRFGGDPARICRNLGIAVVPLRDGRRDWDARLAYRDGAWAVFVNADQPAVRRTFGIAHELMHWAITMNTLTDPPRGQALETLCDLGAHELLFSW
jgi:Zn-dependent peptidase ImmA (M78 family)